MSKRLGIYIHLPFCARKCNYCDFYSVVSGEEEKKAYIKALKREIEERVEYLSCDHRVYTVYFGGGTPSILKGSYIAELLETVRKNFKLHTDDFYPEITIECNPATLDKEKLLIYKNAGINRLSLGLQSTENSELRLLGRIHSYEDFLRSYELVREAGFSNVNIDLISALPKQSVFSYEKSLDRVVKLNPEHISSYSLIVEEGTPFFERYSENAPFFKDLPCEEVERQMYEMTVRKLSAAGYHRYEISNYSKNNLHSRHNISYWERVPYLGFGAAASSFFENERYKNTANIREYIGGIDSGRDVREEKVSLSLTESMAEFMFLGLRCTNGIKKNRFFSEFGKNLEEVYGKEIKKHIKNGLLIEDNNIIRLSDRGLDLSNYVLCDFVNLD